MPVADGFEEDVRRVQPEVLLDLLEEAGEQVDAGLRATQRDPLLLDGHGAKKSNLE